jgi:hypothetical protein
LLFVALLSYRAGEKMSIKYEFFVTGKREKKRKKTVGSLWRFAETPPKPLW